MSKVYVAQEPPLNLNIYSAEEYGELVIVLPRGEYEGEVTARQLQEVRTRIEKFNHRTDYVLPIGGLVNTFILGALFSQLRVPDLRVLRWEKNLGRYVVVTVALAPPAGDPL